MHNMHPYFHGASEGSYCMGRYIPSLPQHAGNKLLGCRSPGRHDEWLAMTVHGRHDSYNQRLKRGDDWRMGWGSLCGTSEHGPSSHAWWFRLPVPEQTVISHDILWWWAKSATGMSRH